MGRELKVNLTSNRGEEIPIGKIDFGRFDKFPVLLNQHNNEMYIGLAKNVRIDNSGFHFIPEFNDITKDAQYLNFLYNEGLLTAQPGGYIERDKDGHIIKFHLFEVSICPC